MARAAPARGTLIPSDDGDLLSDHLPEGWIRFGRCRFGTAIPGPHPTGCHAIAHPGIGVALIDIAPVATPNAEARLRRAVGVAEAWPSLSGTLPVWHGRIERGELPELGRILQEGFAALPQLSLARGQDWIAVLCHLLAQDPAWDIPGHSPRPGTALVLAEPDAEMPPVRPPRRRGPLLFLGFVASFWLGLAAGLVLVSEPDLARTTSAFAPAASLPELADVAATAVLAPASATAEAPARVPQQSPAPPEPAVAAPREEVTASVSAVLAPPDTMTAADLPLGPLAPSAAVRPVARSVAHIPPRPVIDPVCSQALFRFQQGEALSSAERVHLREGCVTRR